MPPMRKSKSGNPNAPTLRRLPLCTNPKTKTGVPISIITEDMNGPVELFQCWFQCPECERRARMVMEREENDRQLNFFS